MCNSNEHGRFHTSYRQLPWSGKRPRILHSNWCTRAFAAFLLWTASAIALPAQTFTTLVNFDGTNGADPAGPLVQGPDGDFWGTTYRLGPLGSGTVFKVDITGTLTTVYSFCSQAHCVDGSFPSAGLVLGSDGDLYGTTANGGANGSGTVFKITSVGALTTLHSFNSSDGAQPVAPLVLGADGAFYGTTAGGGLYGSGTVFKITPRGTFTTLHSFNGTDGDYPPADALVGGGDGNYYGTTGLGGANGFGTAFKITPGGTLTTLYNFQDSGDGANPYAGLVQASDGKFYGATYDGTKSGYGTIFRITPKGVLTTLLTFPADGSQGADCAARLVQATDGNLYGTTVAGGAGSDNGTIFKTTLSGALTTLHSFDVAEGMEPGALVQATSGKFYGVALGGSQDDGTIFSLDTGLGPFVQPVPSFGTVGRQILILGTNLTGATSVSFNGTSARFRVASSTLIKATIPAGATSGFVSVVTPNGTLQSNSPFRVRQ